ncbi:hypothetical protein B0H19DRAFT_1232562 [Mycena capillaripes]|nr:hypothetical protein B0H19DRAFT_1232562 [Mycena capillaripes]
MFAFLIKTIFVFLLVAAVTVWFSTELRAKAYRMVVKLYAKHAEEEEVDNLRKNIGLSASPPSRSPLSVTEGQPQAKTTSKWASSLAKNPTSHRGRRIRSTRSGAILNFERVSPLPSSLDPLPSSPLLHLRTPIIALNSMYHTTIYVR